MMKRLSDPSALSLSQAGAVRAHRLTVPAGLIRPRAIGGAAR
jgi:hypothetical protein